MTDQGWMVDLGDEDEALYDDWYEPWKDPFYDAEPGEPDWDEPCAHRQNTACPWGCPTWGRERRRGARRVGQQDRVWRKRERHLNDRHWLARNERWRHLGEGAPF